MIDFFAPPTRALEFWDEKLPKGFDVDKYKFAAWQRALAIKGISDINTLQSLHKAMGTAMAKGLHFEDVKAQLHQIAPIGEERMRTVFNTNMRSVYNAARYESQLKGSKPYLRYVCVGDTRVREAHAAFHGLVLPKDDDFWRENYPPNGFNCRCKVQAVSESEIKHNEYTVAKRAPKIKAAAPGFDSNPIAPNNALFEVMKDRLNATDPAIRKPAQRIYNNALRDIQQHKRMYKEIRRTMNEWQPHYEKFRAEFLSSEGLSETGLKELSGIKKEEILKRLSIAYTVEISKLTKSIQDRSAHYIALAKFNNRVLYVDKFQLATHLKHKSISAADYAMIGHILNRRGMKISQSSSSKQVTVIISQVGVKYKLAIYDDGDKYLLSSLTFK